MTKTKAVIYKHLVLFLLSCSLFAPLATLGQKEFYIPKALLTPSHNRKNQLHTSLGIGGGYDANLSYAFTNHFAVFTTGTWSKGTLIRISFFGDLYNIVKNDYAVKWGLGYFKKSESLLNILETYAGYGMYKVDNYWYFSRDPLLGGTATQARFWNVFWQFNTGRKTEKYAFGIAGRFSYSIYKNMQFYDTHSNSGYVKGGYDNLKGLTIEPAFYAANTIRKNIFINVQAGLAIPLTKAVVTQTKTYVFSNTPVVRVNKITETLTTIIGRVSLQYNFDFHKKSGNAQKVSAIH